MLSLKKDCTTAINSVQTGGYFGSAVLRLSLAAELMITTGSLHETV